MIAFALAALTANGGSYQRAAQDVSAEWGWRVPRQMIHHWATGKKRAVVGLEAADRAEAVGRHEKALEPRFYRLTELGLRLQEIVLQECLADPQRRAKLNPKDIATATAINVDKVRLLQDRPTSIKADSDLAAFLRGLREPVDVTVLGTNSGRPMLEAGNNGPEEGGER